MQKKLNSADTVLEEFRRYEWEAESYESSLFNLINPVWSTDFRDLAHYWDSGFHFYCEDFDNKHVPIFEEFGAVQQISDISNFDQEIIPPAKFKAMEDQENSDSNQQSSMICNEQS